MTKAALSFLLLRTADIYFVQKIKTDKYLSILVGFCGKTTEKIFYNFAYIFEPSQHLKADFMI